MLFNCVVVCRGTSFGLAHGDNEMDLYNQYKAIYTNCTYVDGNVEIVFLQQQNYDLSFLKDIREVILNIVFIK